MIEAWSPADVYAAEAALEDELASGELMARAVEGLAEVVAARVSQLGAETVVALVGGGNNGADALYAVAQLAESGVTCAAALDVTAVHAGALEAARAAGVVLVTGAEALEDIAEADIVLDGIVGLGGRPGLPEAAAAWVAAIPDDAHVIAVDVPSGQAADGTAFDPDGVLADETVTFSVAKPVHLLPPTEQACGTLSVVDIGLTFDTEPAVVRLTFDDVADLWPVPGPDDDKYSRGVLGVVAGGEQYSGAAVLSVTAAVEAGAGMVRYIGTPTPEGLIRASVPEVVHGEGRVQAWVLGPGLDATSTRREARMQLDVARAALTGAEPVLVDAGGLALVDDDVIDARRERPTLLTPHAGELATLLTRLGARRRARGAGQVEREAVEAEPLRHARALADRTGMTVLLKGSTTLVVPADPTQPVYSQSDAPPWLATAGAGDVLAGLIGTLLAAGLEPSRAGALGALVHGVAADRVSRGGPLRALRVAHGIPDAVAHLLTRG
ncbi:bifunctional ADP-dependent NAD(P)H-hydrate dehydratase/NAD(P)H-hydrate epimerase [Knoellia sp. Soil729]|uniref:bifunctional ADP-dependent NAD(P)H-hydrate dehydratase/NAD(P)H-hydrate epimerase n=1 Tax=Knoellia sp. Soil729 TaxID=1736394 RepID=UPI0006F5C5C2|nr:bifunctional ADP-dependent NAD(P)H-hydrate dehydratase/NAD(P)H-hydrate epimerase [Knoellia sp. Soil729]KRE43904.1 carbohydrate kinase [Knoellia sp. Soil729]